MHNPGAGAGGHSPEGLGALLADAGHEVRYQSTKEEGWKTALAEPSELVAVAGGDGTVSKVFMELAGSGRAATVIPLGSANNIARTLGIALDGTARLARAWESAGRRPYDIGRLRSGLGVARFAESMGGGIFGEVLRRAERSSEDPSGEDKHEHGLELLRAVIGDAEPRRWGLALDGEDISGDFLAVEVMNIREIGPNLPLAPSADPGDGILDVVLIGPEHRESLAGLAEARARGRVGAATPLPVKRGRRLEIRFPAACCLHVDDEVWPGDAPHGVGGAGEVAAGDARVEVLRPSAPLDR
jgi:diacylglycerol kinase (ATP)